MPWISECKALLETFFAGRGWAGRWPRFCSVNVIPAANSRSQYLTALKRRPRLHYPGENLRHHYGEGLFVGYRYYDKRRMTPRFPFGFGLSYTRFAYRDIRLSASRVGADETLTVSFDLTNCGECEGKEIVQLYVSAPVGELIREEQALKGFCKVSLAAGETRRVTLQAAGR